MTFSAVSLSLALDESLEDAIQRADAATYAAKSAGKNRSSPASRLDCFPGGVVRARDKPAP